MRIKKCLMCGKEFYPKRSDAKYCSNTCRADVCLSNKARLKGVKEYQEALDVLLSTAMKKRMFVRMCEGLRMDDDCISGKKKKYGYPMPVHAREYFYEYIGGKDMYEAWKRRQ